MPSFSEQGVATSWLFAQSPAKQKIALYHTVGCVGSEQRETIPRKWRDWEWWWGKCYSQHCHRLPETWHVLLHVCFLIFKILSVSFCCCSATHFRVKTMKGSKICYLIYRLAPLLRRGGLQMFPSSHSRAMSTGLPSGRYPWDGSCNPAKIDNVFKATWNT